MLTFVWVVCASVGILVLLAAAMYVTHGILYAEWNLVKHARTHGPPHGTTNGISGSGRGFHLGNLGVFFHRRFYFLLGGITMLVKVLDITDRE